MPGRIVADLKEYRFAIAGLLVYSMITRLIFHAFCPMVIVTGLPCPGCGLNRAVLFLLRGEFARSFALHPLAALWLALIFWFLAGRYVAGRRVSRGFMVCLGIVAAATLVLYGYRMLWLFPDYPPASYTGGSLCERLFPEYRQEVLAFFRLFR